MREHKIKKNISETIKGIKGLLIIIYIATIASACLRYGLALSYQKTIDSLDTFDIKKITLWLCIGFLFTVLWNIGNYLRSIITVKAGNKIVTKIRSRYLNCCMSASLHETDIIKSGEFLTKLTDDIYTVSSFYTYSIREILFGIIQLITGLYFAFSVSFYFVIVLVVASLICAMANFLFSPLVQKQYALKQIEEDTLKTFSEDRLQHFSLTKIFNLYAIHNKKFTEIISKRTKKIIGLENKAAFFSAFSNFAGYITLISLNIAGALLLYNNKITIGSFVGIFAVSSVVLWPFQFFPSIFKYMAEQKAALKRLNTFENFKEENNENIDENFIAIKLTAENISFKYTENNFLFKNFNYEAKKGYLNVIAGESGKGKTTLAKLLLNLYEPESGEIYFTDTQNKKHKINKKNVSYIPQDCKLFTKTIYENILDGKHDADKNEIEKAARKAIAHLFIEERKEKYNSYIDNSSGIFSYGQKQRIAIARAILKNAELIIFDEPTSALDEKNEKNIISLLLELAKEKIVIVISHSQNIIDKAECVSIL